MAGVSNADSCEAISSSSTIGLVVFLAWSRLVFRLAPIFIDLHNRSIICLFYSLIIPRLSTIKGLLGLAFDRNCYRSPVTIIDRNRVNLLLIMIIISEWDSKPKAYYPTLTVF